MKMKELRFLDKKTVNSILKKTAKSRKIKNFKIISFSRLYKYLNEKEIALIKNFLKLNPRRYGFKGKFFGVIKVPGNLINIKGWYLPKVVFSAFQKMNKVLKNEIGRKLLVDSGYRSPAYQAVLFLYSLKLHKFNFLRTAKEVAFPGYSEHGNLKRQAIDFFAIDSIFSDGEPLGFEKTKEFKWLMKNAYKFGFFLSYPKNNKLGVIYEPWHWRFGE